MNLNGRLVVVSSREDLGAASWDGGVALDETVHDATFGLNTKRQWGDVQEQDVFDIALQHTSLNRSTNGNHFVRVHTLVRLFAGQGLHELLDRWDTS